jgi:hypothetical protein
MDIEELLEEMPQTEHNVVALGFIGSIEGFVGILRHQDYPKRAVVVLPNKHHGGVNKTAEVLGFIPSFMLNNDLPLFEAMSVGYGFPIARMNMDKLVITSDYIYKYLGDPALEPLALYITEGGVATQYPYGIMYFDVEGFPPFWSRMD